MKYRVSRYRSVSVWLRLSVVVLLIGGAPALRAQGDTVIEPAAELPDPITTENPKVPTEELILLLKPMTVTELTSEKNAWMELVKAKVREIATREITVKRQNAQIAVKKEVVDAVSDAKKAIEKAGDSSATAPEAPPEDSATEDDTADAAVQEAVAVAEANAPELAEEVKKAVAEGEDGLNKAAEQVEKELAADQEVKVNNLEELKGLRTERAALVERLQLVLVELKKKGGAAEEDEYYIKAVSNINLDMSDQEATQAAVMGWLTSEEGGLRIAWNLIQFVLILIAGWIVSRIAGGVVDRALRVNKKLSRLMRAFLSTTVRRIVMGVGVIFALSALEIDTAPLLAMIGAAGFVVAFALQGTLSNFASGIMILYFKPFDVGDWVEVAGVAGSVASLNLVSTTINTGDNKKIIVPNNAIWGDVITNATGTSQRRVDMVFGIGYGDDMAKAQEILEKVISEHPAVLDDPAPNIRVHELADSSVNFIVRPWVKTDDYWSTYWDVTRKVKEEFDAAGVSIPFPQSDLHIYHETPLRREPSESESS